MTPARVVRAFGDTGLVVDVGGVDEAVGLAATVAGLWAPGVEDVIVGFGSVTVVADPTTVDTEALRATLSSAPAATTPPSSPAVVEIPVAFDGVDLAEVAQVAGLSPTGVADALAGADLRVAFVGFVPGFGYLTGLPRRLAAVPRRPTPRPSVPAGAVALAGGFAGVYPRASPGGWNLVGRTDMALFDPEAAPYSVLRAGDTVRLRRAEVPADAAPPAPARPALRSGAARTVRVEEPGWLSLVQDGGRIGVAGAGVPRAGAADPYARRLANEMVGNDPGAAVLETTAGGPSLVFSAPAHVAVVGRAPVTIDGRMVLSETVVPVGPGQTLAVGAPRFGLRSYVAVAGGLDTPTVLGSRSSDVLAGLGPGALVAGDVLGLGRAGRPRGRRQPEAPPDAVATLRVMAGPDRPSPPTIRRLTQTAWEVDGASDRIGVRLRAPVALEAPPGAVASRGMVTGAVQVPPDGRPIVLSCDHATVGGYPVVATVVSADLGVLGQLRPGQGVRFELVDLDGARRARAEREKVLGRAISGWYPVETA